MKPFFSPSAPTALLGHNMILSYKYIFFPPLSLHLSFSCAMQLGIKKRGVVGTQNAPRMAHLVGGVLFRFFLLTLSRCAIGNLTIAELSSPFPLWNPGELVIYTRLSVFPRPSPSPAVQVHLPLATVLASINPSINPIQSIQPSAFVLRVLSSSFSGGEGTVATICTDVGEGRPGGAGRAGNGPRSMRQKRLLGEECAVGCWMEN